MLGTLPFFFSFLIVLVGQEIGHSKKPICNLAQEVKYVFT